MRVAVISFHTSPIEQPGRGNAGGMNVFIRSVWERLAKTGLQADIFTRRASADSDLVERPRWGRVINVPAGPPVPFSKSSLVRVLPDFLEGVLRRIALEPRDGGSPPYDLVHAHYWMSGLVGSRLSRRWGIPLVASFHTLGLVKNSASSPGDQTEPRVRLEGERYVTERASTILVPSPQEAGALIHLYQVDPQRVWLAPPGVDHKVFVPRNRAEARARLGFPPGPLILYAGRLQAYKCPDLAIRSIARLVEAAPEFRPGLRLVMVGGSTHDGSRIRLQELAGRVGVSEHVMFMPAQPQAKLADLYAASDAVLIPSRSESFGLVALEAQSCGRPVVASRQGGLAFTVRDGETGLLVDPADPAAYARALVKLLRDPDRAAAMGEAGVAHAAGFTWTATANVVRSVYGAVTGSLQPVT